MTEKIMDIGKGGVCAAKGFWANAVGAGIKKHGLDLVLIRSNPQASAAVVETKNLFKAAPVLVTREHLEKSEKIEAVLVNAGNANACTGSEGIGDARRCTSSVAGSLHVKPEQVLVASTGVIGVRLPMDKMLTGIEEICLLARTGAADELKAAKGIMTTDTRPKTASVKFDVEGRTVTLGGMTKGSGMIAPNMATMLGFITTDAKISSILLQKQLKNTTERTFNRITVDSDTSTNDTVMILANGASGVEISSEDKNLLGLFTEALEKVCCDLSEQIVLDGEGATKLIRVVCCGARTESEADKVARTVANSPLVKTAMFGNDANWGRIVAAVGRADVELTPERVSVHIGPVQVVKKGEPTGYSEMEATQAVSGKEVVIRIHLGDGNAEAEIKTCDFSYDYVKINAAYRT